MSVYTRVLGRVSRGTRSTAGWYIAGASGGPGGPADVRAAGRGQLPRRAGRGAAHVRRAPRARPHAPTHAVHPHAPTSHAARANGGR